MKKRSEDYLNEHSLISPVKRCPQCNSLSFIFDEKEGALHCTNCGFKTFIKK